MRNLDLDGELYPPADTEVTEVGHWSDEIIDQFDRMLASHGLEIVTYGDQDVLIWKIEKRAAKAA
jgi:hypothetical protein